MNHGDIVAWTSVPDGIARPIKVSLKKTIKKLDLTGDRPLTRAEARKLKRWWESNGWSVSLSKVSNNRFFVKASKEVYDRS